jgi:ABC-2 type transport system ATP-binding protein
MTHRVTDLVARSSILVLATHADSLIREMCNKACLLEQGRVVAAGEVDAVLARYHKGASG